MKEELGEMVELTSTWASTDSFVAKAGGGRVSSSSLESMGSMVTIGEGFSWGKMEGMITTVDRMINCELTT